MIGEMGLLGRNGSKWELVGAGMYKMGAIES